MDVRATEPDHQLLMTPTEVATVTAAINEADRVGMDTQALAGLLGGTFTVADLALAHLHLEAVRTRRMGRPGGGAYGHARVAALRAQRVLCADTSPSSA